MVDMNKGRLYVRTTIVWAWPEPRDGVEGYGVLYTDGYQSWCPKESFEEASRPLSDREVDGIKNPPSGVGSRK